jgi:hypothetical protein
MVAYLSGTDGVVADVVCRFLSEAEMPLGYKAEDWVYVETELYGEGSRAIFRRV